MSINAKKSEYLEKDSSGWKTASCHGYKEKRWLNGFNELWVEENENIYEVNYREGRFGPSSQLNYSEFDDLNQALEYASLIVDGEVNINEVLE